MSESTSNSVQGVTAQQQVNPAVAVEVAKTAPEKDKESSEFVSSNVAKLKKDAPEVYDATVKSIAQQINRQLAASSRRLKKAMKEAYRR